MGDPLVLLVLLASAATAALLVRAVAPPLPRLAGRVRPFSLAARASLGRAADVRAVATPLPDHHILRRLLDPVLRPLAADVARRAGSASEAGLARRIRQARSLREVPADQRLAEFHLREAFAAATGLAGGIAVGTVLGLRPVVVVLLGLAGLVFGAVRLRSGLDTTIEARTDRMRVELYTVNHLIAMHVRVGGGIVQALQRVVERGNGEIVDELREALRAHESGVTVRDALRHAALDTPEPQVARTYRLLASGAEYGADLADALLAHSDDVREARREALRRTATRRRAATLLPIIGVLAPVMLLFIAAPLPSIVFGAQ